MRQISVVVYTFHQGNLSLQQMDTSTENYSKSKFKVVESSPNR